MTWTIKLCGNPSKVLAEIMADEKVPASVRLLVEDEIGEIPFSFDSVIVAGCGKRGSSFVLLVEPFHFVEAAPAPAPAPAPVTANAPAPVPVETETPAEVIPVPAPAEVISDSVVTASKSPCENCPDCHGTGTEIPGSGIPCATCHGTGKVTIVTF
jgi:hypothetical protein